MKIYRRIFIAIIILGFLGFIIYMIYDEKQAKKRFIQNSFNGIINEIKYEEDRHDLPTVKIGNTIYCFGYEGKTKNYIRVGDSIVKESGSEVIKVFRKNEKGIWDVKIF